MEEKKSKSGIIIILLLIILGVGGFFGYKYFAKDKVLFNKVDSSTPYAFGLKNNGLVLLYSNGITKDLIDNTNIEYNKGKTILYTNSSAEANDNKLYYVEDITKDKIEPIEVYDLKNDKDAYYDIIGVRNNTIFFTINNEHKLNEDNNWYLKDVYVLMKFDLSTREATKIGSFGEMFVLSSSIVDDNYVYFFLFDKSDDAKEILYRISINGGKEEKVEEIDYCLSAFTISDTEYYCEVEKEDSTDDYIYDVSSNKMTKITKEEWSKRVNRPQGIEASTIYINDNTINIEIHHSGDFGSSITFNNKKVYNSDDGLLTYSLSNDHKKLYIDDYYADKDEYYYAVIDTKTGELKKITEDEYNKYTNSESKAITKLINIK